MDDSSWTLAGIKILEGLTPAEIRELDTKCVWRRFAADAVIVDRNDATSEMFYLIGGKARVVHRVDDGRKVEEITFATLTPGAMFGEIAAIDGHGRSASVVANEDCVVATMSAADFKGLLATHGIVGVRVLERFASIIRLLDNRVTDLSLLTPDQRIYHEVMRLARPESEPDGVWVVDELPGHQELADWSNTTRETVAYAIGSLLRRGIVERKHKRLYIRDPKMLRSMSR
ncbi:MAG: Crp/Fnr family transcriptional regulator [Pseudomonadota bacterium]